ncbi:PREDICTED: probable low-specificity L-threonine aldolase 2 [Capra hircus]|uniref:probable low-specificity L-threonine aldolase 2 n=1 Tax=Capra hircus TaxID=9925 RepID=UPI0008477500|nr:PREDICTED: probable low-specificity L-threonine aldolase 2 [Capra hircus]
MPRECAQCPPRRKLNYNSQHAAGALRPARVNRGRSLESPAAPIQPRKIGAGGPGTIPAMLRRLARAAIPRQRVFWAQRSGSLAEIPTYVVDLRSDTVTKPGPAMRRAMAEAVVGDDDYGEDPTVRDLQATAAELLGVERTLFVPTNTMANLISVMCHCRRRGSQLLLGRECHLHVYEQGGVAQIAGVHSHPLADLPHGTLDLAELERLVKRGLGSPYHPVCELICLENTHSSSGGRVLPMEYLRQVHLLARRYGVRVHLDGARLMNAAVALGVPPARIVEHCDSVSLCFSKGLGAPVGALVGGPKDFIEEAWRLRKALGGGMRQAGVLAAAALVGLADTEEMLQRDHQNAQRFARGLQELASPVCSVDPTAVETNMVMVRVDGLPPEELCRRLQAVSADEVAQTGHAVRLLLFPWTEHSVRAVWHRDVSAQDTELALGKWAFVLRTLGLG